MTRILISAARHPFDRTRTVYLAYQVRDNGKLVSMRLGDTELYKLMAVLDTNKFAEARPCWMR